MATVDTSLGQSPQTIASSALPETELGAWVLPVGPDVAVAVGRYELKYIEYVKECVTLPGLPAFCQQGFMWHDRFIPVLDVHSLITRKRIPHVEGEQMVAIVAHENSQGVIELGAILLRGVPTLLRVSPQQSVAVTELQTEWQLLAHAAFGVDDKVYPVVDLRCLFESTPADVLALH